MMSPVGSPSGIITLLTDFGTQDTYVGAMKGAILREYPRAVIVDLSHEVRPFTILQAAFLLDSAWQAFPTETVHLVVVDPGVGGARQGLAFVGSDHFFVGPDNGVFTYVLERMRVEAVALPVPPDASSTFHGRDVFALAGARLARGVSLSELGSPVSSPQPLKDAWAARVGEGWRGQVLHCDRYGNVVTSVPASALPHLHAVNGMPVRVVRTYEDAKPQELVALAGSAGRVELALAGASAAARLRAAPGEVVLVT